MESNRQLKFSKMIRKDLGEIFQQDVKDHFGKAFITVTNVRMSPDLGIARVYLSLMLVEDKDLFIESVIEKKGLIRKILGNRIGKKVRMIPDLLFFLDDSSEYADNIDRILNDLNIPPEDNQ